MRFFLLELDGFLEIFRSFDMRIRTWIRHPVLSWQAHQRSKLPVVDLDNPENNCPICGVCHRLETLRLRNVVSAVGAIRPLITVR